MLYQVFLSNKNNLHMVVLFQVFLSHINNYKVPSNYSYLIIIIIIIVIICLQL